MNPFKLLDELYEEYYRDQIVEGERNRREKITSSRRLACDLCGRIERERPTASNSPGELEDDDMMIFHVVTDKSKWFWFDPKVKKAGKDECEHCHEKNKEITAQIELIVYPNFLADVTHVCADCAKEYETSGGEEDSEKHVKVICVSCSSSPSP
jgi:hypothetical protein